MSKKINAITKRPGCPPRSVNVSNTLKNLHELVGGYIETVTFSCGTGKVIVICNEEGRWLGLPHNVTINGIEFVGDIVVVGMDESGEDFGDLPFGYAEMKKLLPELWGVCSHKYTQGDRVKFITGSKHDLDPGFYPPVGTVGRIDDVADSTLDAENIYVCWPCGSTSCDDCWWCSEDDIELAEENEE